MIYIPRQNTAEGAALNNIILARGERGYEYDTKRWKTGDGITHWNDLPYDDGLITELRAVGTGFQLYSNGSPVPGIIQVPGASWATIAGRPYDTLTKFGAVADGAITYNPITGASIVTGTDNTAAINNALASGKPVVIPPGIFRYAGILHTDKNGGGLIGVGSGACVLATSTKLDNHLGVITGTKNTVWTGFTMVGPHVWDDPDPALGTGGHFNRAIIIGLESNLSDVNPTPHVDASGTWIDDVVTRGYCAGMQIAWSDNVHFGRFEAYDMGDNRAEPGGYGITCSGSNLHGQLLIGKNTLTRGRHCLYMNGLANDCWVEEIDAKGWDYAPIQNRCNQRTVGPTTYYGGKHNGFGRARFEDCNTNQGTINNATHRGTVNWVCANDDVVPGAGGGHIGDIIAINCGGFPGPAIRNMPNTRCGTVQVFGHSGKSTTLAANASIGAGTVSLTASLPVGNYQIDSDLVKITAVSGSGPYTATLQAVLTAAHTSGTRIMSGFVDDHFGAMVWQSDNVQLPFIDFFNGFDAAGLNDPTFRLIHVESSKNCYGGGLRMHAGGVFLMGPSWKSADDSSIGECSLDGVYTYGTQILDSLRVQMPDFFTTNGIYSYAVRFTGTSDLCSIANVRPIAEPTTSLVSEASTLLQHSMVMRAPGFDEKTITSNAVNPLAIDATGLRSLILDITAGTLNISQIFLQHMQKCLVTSTVPNPTLQNQIAGNGQMELAGLVNRVMGSRDPIEMMGYITGTGGSYTKRSIERKTRASMLIGDTARAIGVGSIRTATRTTNAQVGTTFTPALSDAGGLVTLTNASAITVTVPTNTSVAYPINTEIDLVQLGAGQVTVVGAGGVTVTGIPGLKISAQYGRATLLKTGTNSWILSGPNLSA